MFKYITMIGLIFLCASQTAHAMEWNDSDVLLLAEQRNTLRAIHEQLPTGRRPTKEKMGIGTRYNDEFWKSVYKVYLQTN